jgi:hypothetical protein
MKSFQRLLLGILVIPAISLADDQPWKLAEELLVHSRKGLRFEKTSDKHSSHGMLASVSFTEPSGESQSVIVEGLVKHSNNGAPLERVPVYIAADKDSVPKLAGMTNCDGKFKFRLWIKDGRGTAVIQTTRSFDGYLYVMGTFDGSELLDGSYTQRFELAELYRRFKQGAGKADLRQPASRAELKVEGSGKPRSGSEGSSR